MLNWPKKVCHNLISMDRRIWGLLLPRRIQLRRISCRFRPQHSWAMPLLWQPPRTSSMSIRWVWFFFITFLGFLGFSFSFFTTLIFNFVSKKILHKNLKCQKLGRKFYFSIILCLFSLLVIAECVSCDCFTVPRTIQWIWSLSLCNCCNRLDQLKKNPQSYSTIIFFIFPAGAGAGTGFMTPYGAYATLPQQGAFNGLSPYQNAAAQQEARLQ